MGGGEASVFLRLCVLLPLHVPARNTRIATATRVVPEDPNPGGM